MATSKVRHSTNYGNIRVLMTSPTSGVVMNLRARALATQAAAKRRLNSDPRRIDTGLLVNSIQIREYIRNGAIVERIGTDVEYANYVHQGTRYMEANPFLVDGLREGFTQFS
jgi:hypothetical protein